MTSEMSFFQIEMSPFLYEISFSPITGGISPSWSLSMYAIAFCYSTTLMPTGGLILVYLGTIDCARARYTNHPTGITLECKQSPQIARLSTGNLSFFLLSLSGKTDAPLLAFLNKTLYC